MEDKTKKRLLFGCGGCGALLILSCIILIAVGYLYGEKIVFDMGAMAVKEQLTQVLPPGVDKEKVNTLIDTLKDDIMEKKDSEDVDPARIEEFTNNYVTPLMQGSELTPEDFNNMLNDANEILYNSSLDEEIVKEIKEAFEAGMEDESLDADEINKLIDLAQKALESQG